MRLITFIKELEKLLPQYSDCDVIAWSSYGIGLDPGEPEIRIYPDDDQCVIHIDGKIC